MPTKPELLARAVELGVPADPSWSKAEIEAACDAVLDAAVPPPAGPMPLVDARYVGVEDVFVPKFGLIIRQGDIYPVTAEQLAADPRLQPAADPFTPTPTASTEGA